MREFWYIMHKFIFFQIFIHCIFVIFCKTHFTPLSGFARFCPKENILLRFFRARVRERGVYKFIRIATLGKKEVFAWNNNKKTKGCH